ncbi:hypothetical protein [Kineococcus radiotolerans]|uniref:Uncharacterized protein n=1 Tax=Kineococcus radiotolerans (strain ATCC BAA-149 / DSM 14245 / SRS30216) TaxID=266940 RepID=A6WBG7_KINRD|nr:hypothetical protein [Kineococcus radiotolerans]ABS04156.1 hypothetical protein Krad_2684 [Kineococcus radiotolerans SRS30216 = ATCC BAA-149]
MPDAPQVAPSPLQRVRDHLHSADRDRTAQGRNLTPAQATRTADLRSRVHELGQDALAAGDEALALKTLWLIDEIAAMDRALLRDQG